MDSSLVQKIYQDVVHALSQGEARERLLASGNEPLLSEPAVFARFLQSEMSRWGEVVRANDLRIN